MRGLAPFAMRGRTGYRVTHGVAYGVPCEVRLRFSYGAVWKRTGRKLGTESRTESRTEYGVTRLDEYQGGATAHITLPTLETINADCQLDGRQPDGYYYRFCFARASLNFLGRCLNHPVVNLNSAPGL